MTRRLWVLCATVALAVTTAQVAYGQLITNVQWRNSTNAGAPQLVTEGLHVGDMVFVDRINVNNRTTRYAVVPEFLLGCEYVMLANNDRSTANFELEVTLARAGTIYMFIDNRVGDNNGDTPPNLGGSVMPWVVTMGFVSTYELVGLDEKNQGNIDRWATVYKLDVPAGTTTLRQQNDGTSRNMYCVAAWAPSPTAFDPKPEDGAVDVPIGTTLAWTPGGDAQLHDVYFGGDFNDVSQAGRGNPLNVLVGKGQDANTFDPPGDLEFGETYSWRVDEIAVDGTVTRGAVWQFEAEPQGYPIAGSLITATASSSQAGSGPENTINRSGLDPQDGHSTAAKDMWQSEGGAVEPVWIQYELDKVYKVHEVQVWNYNGDLEFLVGFGLREVTVQHSLDGTAWAALGDFTFVQGSSLAGYMANTTVDFGGVAARYVRLVVNSSWGSSGRHGLSEVRFSYIPTWARAPSPASGQTEVDTDAVLSWRAGRDAASHKVYLSTDEQGVVAGTAMVGTNLKNVRTLTIGVDSGGYGTLLFDDIRLYRLAPEAAQEEMWIEAEAADSMVSPMRRYSDRPDAWGGQYIATFGDSSSGDPPDNGVASYTVKLTGGTYRIIGRVIAPTGNDDSFWVRFQSATTNTANHASGWVRWGLDIGDTWHDVPVRSMDDADQTVLFTVEPGVYNLEIAFREDGALLDAWMITKQLQ